MKLLVSSLRLLPPSVGIVSTVFLWGIFGAGKFSEADGTDVRRSGYWSVLCHMDDILVFGSSQEEYDVRFRKVLERISNNGLTLNKEKCEFNVQSVEFLGHVVASSGIWACDDKITAILEMPSPMNAKELKWILRMVDYMRKFNPCLGEAEVPLRKLLKKHVEWGWGPEQESSFCKLKNLLTTFPVLATFDVNKKQNHSRLKPTFSGTALRQQQDTEWCPVAYASRTLLDTERWYAQIGKEALAATWACQKFNFYLVGRHFEIETDHKPLVPLLVEKDLSQLALRVQCFKFRLMRYDYHIYHSPGKKM